MGKKMKLDDLKVQSFITDLSQNNKDTAKGKGYSYPPMPGCGPSYTCGNPCSNDPDCASTAQCSEVGCGGGGSIDTLMGPVKGGRDAFLPPIC